MAIAVQVERLRSAGLVLSVPVGPTAGSTRTTGQPLRNKFL
jgi:hypothetical protein